MNIRMLIARAIEEARSEFEAVVVKRLAELMGDDAAVEAKPTAAQRVASSRTARAKPARKRVLAAKGKPARKAAPAAKPTARTKTAATASPARKVPAGPADDGILRALAKGDALGRSAIMKAGGYSAKDDTRVGLALIRLRTDGRIVMSGTRRGTTYRIATRGAAQAPTAETTHAPTAAATAATIVSAPAPSEKRARRARAAPIVVAAPEAVWRPTVIRRPKSE